jgi:hypothetical protein
MIQRYSLGEGIFKWTMFRPALSAAGAEQLRSGTADLRN